MSARNSLLGLGIGAAAAVGAAAVGVAADRLRRARGTAVALGTTGEYDVVPDTVRVVTADDGVPLHVEIDEPRAPRARGSDGGPVPTVVFSHGWTLSLRSWVFQRRVLRDAGYRVVLWDQRGHGSSGTGDRSSYDVDQLGRDLTRVLAEAAPEGPLVLVGHSMGGMTMMAFAEQHPDAVRDRVVGAAFVATSPGDLRGVSWGLGTLLGQMVHRAGPTALDVLAPRQPLVDAARRAGRPVEEYLVQRYSFASPVPLSVVRFTADMIFDTSMQVMAGFAPTLDAHEKRQALAAYHGTEVLVLSGSDDLLTPTTHSDEIVRHLPGAEQVVVNDAGHLVMLEHPDLVNEQLLALLVRVRRSAEAPAGSGPPVRHTVTDLAKRRRDREAARRAAGRSRRSGRRTTHG